MRKSKKSKNTTFPPLFSLYGSVQGFFAGRLEDVPANLIWGSGRVWDDILMGFVGHQYKKTPTLEMYVFVLPQCLVFLTAVCEINRLIPDITTTRFWSF